MSLIKRIIIVFLLVIFLVGCNQAPDEYDEYDEYVIIVEPEPTPAPTPPPLTDTLEVHFIDVGFGESILVRQGRYTMLIDGGNYPQRLLDYLNEQGVEHFDLVFQTNKLNTHITGLIYALLEFPADYIILANDVFPTDEVVAFWNTLERLSEEPYHVTTIMSAHTGLAFNLGQAEIQIISPYADTVLVGQLNRSTVIRIVFGQTAFLFMSNAITSAENLIMQETPVLTSHVLKVGRHGYQNATSAEFLEAVNPAVAIVMDGSAANNQQFFHQATRQRLEDANVQVFETYHNGTIIITSDGNSLEIVVGN